MIYILNIGYNSYAFSSSRGLQTVMDAMSKARLLKRHYCQGCEREDPERLELSDGPVEIGMHCVQGVSFVSGKRARREVIEPEVMPRQRGGEGDAVFAARLLKGRLSDREQAPALTAKARERLGNELRLALGEGK
jgi:hypothetical protein